MSANGSDLFLTASWVLPVSAPPLPSAFVHVSDGKIAAIYSRSEFNRLFPGRQAIDFGSAIILPGLINLHSHLDYSALRLLDVQSALLDWIPQLSKRASAWNQQQWRHSALLGAQEAALTGTSCLADSSYSGAAAWAAAATGLRATVGLELFGLDEKQADKRWSLWLERWQKLKNEPDEPLDTALADHRVRLTVSPHAPYTVCPQLWEKALAWACQFNLPVFCHLSESVSEVNWVAGDEEKIDRFLTTMLPHPLPATSWKGQGLTPTAMLAARGLLSSNTVAAHAVHLSAADLELLAQSGTTIAHCPRSNARLRNGAARLSRLLSAGVQIGLGTDSAASNDDLDLLAETRFAWNLARALDPQFSQPAKAAVEMLTIKAACALGLDDQIGSLEVGKKADIAVFSLAEKCLPSQADPYDLLLYGKTNLYSLYVDGRLIVDKGKLAPECHSFWSASCSASQIPLF